jgi:Undecaprenyl-phosphate glucose phosphotransferase
MSQASEVPRPTDQQVKTAVVDVVPPGPARRMWKGLLRPEHVEGYVVAADMALIIVAGYFSSLVYHWIAETRSANQTAFELVTVVLAVNFAAIMMVRRNYALTSLMLLAKQMREIFIIWFGVSSTLVVLAFTLKVSGEFSRGSAISFFMAGLVALLSSRIIVARLIPYALAKGLFSRKRIVVIAERHQDTIYQPLNELGLYGYHVVKTCAITREELTAPGIARSLRTKLAEIVQTGMCEPIEEVYLVVGWQHRRLIAGILDALAVLPVPVHLVPDESAAHFLNHPTTMVGDTWTVELRRTPLNKTELAAKRAFDLFFAGAAIVSLLPLMVITALLIKLDSRGPIFFLQTRNGFNQQPFSIFKFRTMHCLDNGPVIRQATKNDPRVTRLGRWLRRSSIDELPQLFNVIRGEMSLVGPRPHAQSHNSEYEKLIANYAFRHHVKPGLTGWAQVRGYRGETRHVEQMERRVAHDLWYINNWSLWLDFKIVFLTILSTLRQKAY